MSQALDSWKKKVNPAFCEIPAIYGALAAAQQLPDRDQREVRRILSLFRRPRRALAP
jgi:hypothetical protein